MTYSPNGKTSDAIGICEKHGCRKQRLYRLKRFGGGYSESCIECLNESFPDGGKAIREDMRKAIEN